MPSAGLLGWREWKYPRPNWEKENVPQKESGALESDNWDSDKPKSFFGKNNANPVRHPKLSIGHELYLRSFQPYKKCWFTDVTAPLNTHQGNMCQDFELRASLLHRALVQ